MSQSYAPSRRALLVDDDDNERELLAGYLRLTGFEVETATDGLQAMVQLSRDRRPDVVLMDMHMPRFDGRKAVTAIREDVHYQSLPIFAVTGCDAAEEQIEIGPAGVNRWFRKPVNPKILVEAINEDLCHACGPT